MTVMQPKRAWVWAVPAVLAVWLCAVGAIWLVRSQRMTAEKTVTYVAEHPIVNLRAFRNVSFSTGNVVMFVAFFNLFGSIVLLPLFAQLLLRWTSFLAGFVLSPGGIATLLTMPLVGRLIVKRNPKYLLAFGIAVCAFSTWEMAHFSLNADFASLM